MDGSLSSARGPQPVAVDRRGGRRARPPQVLRRLFDRVDRRSARDADGRPLRVVHERRQEANVIAEYPYVDEDGKTTIRRRAVVPEVRSARSVRTATADGSTTCAACGASRTGSRRFWPRPTSGETVYVVEGEKDVAALERLGLTATTNAGGAEQVARRVLEAPHRGPRSSSSPIATTPDGSMPRRSRRSLQPGTRRRSLSLSRLEARTSRITSPPDARLEELVPCREAARCGRRLSVVRAIDVRARACPVPVRGRIVCGMLNLAHRSAGCGEVDDPLRPPRARLARGPQRR